MGDFPDGNSPDGDSPPGASPSGDSCGDGKNILCAGFNGLKSIFKGGRGSDSDSSTSTLSTTSTTSSDAVTTAPTSATTSGEATPLSQPPPPAPMPQATTITQISTSSSVSILTSVSTSTSVVVAGIPATQSFITNLPTGSTSIPNTLPTSSSSVAAPPPSSTTLAGAEAAAPIVAQAQSFPTGLVVGLSVTLAVIAGCGIAFWYFCFRKRSRKRPVLDYSGEEASVTETYRSKRIYRGNDEANSTKGAKRPDVTYDPGMREVEESRFRRIESWQSRPPSILTLTDNRASFEGTESGFPEPLSPRPVVQQTVQRVSMPRPVDASSFKSQQGSVAGSSETSNTYSVRQVEVKRPVPAVGHAQSPSTSSSRPTKPEFARESAKVLANLSSRAARRKQASNAKSMTPATLLEVPVGLVPEQASTEKSGLAQDFKVAYTLRRSPLAQNPFNDPAYEDLPTPIAAAKSVMFPTNTTVSPGIPRETQDEKSQATTREKETE